MKKWLLVVIVLIVFVGAWAVMKRMPSPEQPATPSRPPRPDTTKPNQTGHLHAVGLFTRFQPKRVALPFTFEYPKDWVAGEEIGRNASYQQVIILGPRNPNDTYNAGLTIRALPTKAAGGDYTNLEELVKWRQAQHARSRAFQLLQEQPRQLLDWDGVELQFQAEADLVKAAAYGTMPTTVKTHLIVVSHGDRLMEFSYSADAKDYDRFHHAFEHLLQSVQAVR